MADGIFPPPFRLVRPDGDPGPVIVCSAHSGRYYPDDFRKMSRLDARDLRRSEDCYVDALIAAAPRLGATLMIAHYPRAYVDLNREPYELDPLLFKEPLPDFANRTSERVAAGLGTIARIVANGMTIYDHQLDLAEGLHRIERIHRPWHKKLAALLEEARARHGWSLLVDCHSMPSRDVRTADLPQKADPWDADFVLGDRYGASADPGITALAESMLKERGFRVNRNLPYAGGYATSHYGDPARGTHALQIEIDRGLYLDEASFEPGRRFDDIRDAVESIIAALGRLDLSEKRRAAAE